MQRYDITPVPKPRMTQRDKWYVRPAVSRYWQFKDAVRAANIVLPPAYWIKFYIPMPKSWSGKKRNSMRGELHRQIPDKDNLEKALLDALYQDDAHIAIGGCEKRWADIGCIEVYEISEKWEDCIG